MRSLKVLLILGNLEGMISFEKKPEGIHVNHALKHRNNGEIRGDHSVNRSAYINHIHDKSSRERNPSRCHSQAEKSTGHSYSQRCHFPYICIGENMPNWRDGNYLNDFVVLYFTDGSWQAQILPTQIYTLEESELGKVCENRGITPALEYVKGWRAFVDLLQFGLILGSIVVICSVSTVFAKEGQTKMLPLIFTTEEGRRKDVYSKVFAAFLLTATVFIGIVLLDFILCNLVYGMDGFTNMTGIVLGEKMLRAVYQVNFPQYLVRLLLFGLQGLFLLCAITLVISANYNTSFATVIVSAVCWGMPVILRMFLMGMSAIFIYATPLFLVMHGCLDDVYGAGGIVLCISLLTGIICTVVGFLKYKTKEA